MTDQELLTMQEAIERLATTRATLNRWMKAGSLKGLKVGRQWRFEASEIERFLKGEHSTVDLPVSPAPLIDTLLNAIPDTEHRRRLGEDESRHIDRVVHLLLMCGILRGAQAQFIDRVKQPNGMDEGRYSLRIDGSVHPIADYDTRLHQPIIDQIKKLASMDVTERRVPQDSVIKMQLSQTKAIEIVVSTLPALSGETCCLRIRDPASAALPLSALGVTETDEARIKQMMSRSHGLYVVGGLSQSGKTVTLLNMLQPLLSPDNRVLGIEQEPSLKLPGVVHTFTNWQVGMGVNELIRAASRQSWDLLYVGDVEKPETLALLLESALLGKVFTNLHMKDAIGGYTTIKAWAETAGDELAMITSQRLVRRLCSSCRVAHEPDDADLAFIRQIVELHGLTPLEGDYYAPVGCEACNDGYLGRIGLFETLVPSLELDKAMSDGASPENLLQLAIEEGMQTMSLDGIRKAAQGITSLREVWRVTGDLLS